MAIGGRSLCGAASARRVALGTKLRFRATVEAREGDRRDAGAASFTPTTATSDGPTCSRAPEATWLRPTTGTSAHREGSDVHARRRRPARPARVRRAQRRHAPACFGPTRARPPSTSTTTSTTTTTRRSPRRLASTGPGSTSATSSPTAASFRSSPCPARSPCSTSGRRGASRATRRPRARRARATPSRRRRRPEDRRRRCRTPRRREPISGDHDAAPQGLRPRRQAPVGALGAAAPARCGCRDGARDPARAVGSPTGPSAKPARPREDAPAAPRAKRIAIEVTEAGYVPARIEIEHDSTVLVFTRKTTRPAPPTSTSRCPMARASTSNCPATRP